MDRTYLEYQVPFCQPFNCTRSEATTGYATNSNLWSCLPRYCRTNMTVLMACTAMLAVITIACNVIILSINFSSKTRRMRKRNPTMNNYSVYVLSLAVADLLVGLVVLPLCLMNFYREFLINNDVIIGPGSNLDRTDNFTSSEVQLIRASKDFNVVASDENVNSSPSSQENIVKEQFIQFTAIPLQLLGVFTHLTLFVSIYTLIAASSDRLYAAKYSALYVHTEITKKGGHETGASCITRKWRNTRRSSIAVGWVWAFGIFFAIAPFLFHKKVHFRHVGHVFSAMASDSTYSTVIYWYLATLILPLVGIWVLNVLICSTLWRRKAQLGIQRRRSLRRESIPETTEKLSKQVPQNQIMARLEKSSKKDNMHERISGNASVSKSSFKDSNKQRDRCIYNKSSRQRDTMSHSVHNTWSRNIDNKSSLLRRRVSSLRRAKQMVQLRSSESSITKTLCMVVIAFTAAVLPLVISLSKITKNENESAQALNNEVTALTVSLLFLFSNSVVNCVIYGARMRDFRSTLDEHIRAVGDKAKNVFCYCCLERSERYSSEVVSGVYFVSSKQQRSDASEKSSRHAVTSTSDRLRLILRGSSKKSSEQRGLRESCERSSRDSCESQGPIPRGVLPKTVIDKLNKKVPRPSSSGYRTDPEPLSISIQDEQRRKRLSEKSDIVEKIPEIKLEAPLSNCDPDDSHYTPSSSNISPSRNSRPKSLALRAPRSKEESSSRQIRPSSDIASSLNEAIKISTGAAEEYTTLFDYGNHRDSRIITPTGVCLDIDFAQFKAMSPPS